MLKKICKDFRIVSVETGEGNQLGSRKRLSRKQVTLHLNEEVTENVTNDTGVAERHYIKLEAHKKPLELYMGYR